MGTEVRVSSEDNKELVRRYIQAVDEQDERWSVIDEYLAADFVAHISRVPRVGLDRDGMKQAAEIFRVATSGTHGTQLQVAERDLVVSHILGWSSCRRVIRHSPTNKEVEEGIAIHRIRGGKIVEYWSVTDVARVLQQVGALPGG
jgi:ketosteroid isomerase-like protein